MAITKKPLERTREDTLVEIRRGCRPRRFNEMLGPNPQPGDAEDLEDFLCYLHSYRRPVQAPDGEELR